MRDTRAVLVWIGILVSVAGLVFGVVLALHSVEHPGATPEPSAGGSTTISPSPTATATIGNHEHSPTPQPVTFVLPSSIAVTLRGDSAGGSGWLGPVSGVVVALSAVATVILPMQLRPRDHVAAEREQIAKLAVMRDHGIVSDEEFAAAKAELLAKIVLGTKADSQSQD